MLYIVNFSFRDMVLRLDFELRVFYSYDACFVNKAIYSFRLKELFNNGFSLQVNPPDSHIHSCLLLLNNLPLHDLKQNSVFQALKYLE